MPKFRVRKGAKHYWKKSVVRGGSDSILANRLLKEGAVIECEEHELGNARDKFIEVKDEDRVEVEEPIYGFTLDKVGDGEYDVVSIKTGKRINDRTLDFDEAKQLAKNGGKTEND